MKQNVTHRYLLLFIDIAVLALCVFGVEQSRQKAWFGVDLDDRATSPEGRPIVGYVRTVQSPLRVGDEILRIAGETIRTAYDIEQVLDQFRAGDTQHVTVRRGDAEVTEHVMLSAYYSRIEIVIQAAAIAVFFFLGLLVLWRQPRDPSSLQFHHLAVLVACVLAFTAGRFTMEPWGIGHLLRALLPFSNAFIGSAMLHFALIFPTSRQLSLPAMLLLHLPPAVVSIWGAIASLQATLPFDLSVAPAFYLAVATGKAMLGLGAVASVAVFIRNFLRCRDSAHRRQIAWAMTGATLSTGAFILWQLSTSIQLQNYLPAGLLEQFRGLHMGEAVLNGALLTTAAFMAIGIIRYRMFNIELILKRGTVYTFVLLILILVNAAILSFGIRMVGGLSGDTYFLIMSALTVDLLLFIPVRDVVERLTNRYFFRVDYNYREALRRISEQVLVSVQAEDAAKVIVSGLNSLLQLDGIMVMVVRSEGTLQVLERHGFERWNYPALRVRGERLRRLPKGPIVYGDVIEAGADAQRSDAAFARRYNVSMLHPLRTEDGAVIGLLILGKRKSGMRFTLEDVDLIRAVTVQAGLQFERLLLQQRLLMQKEEAEKLRELNRIKSFFVSGVSHDLKTPLTSISMFAELLEDQLPEESGEARKSLEIIQGECGRLARLIDNVLDFTRIERGMVQYQLRHEDLNELARRVLDTMAYQLRIGGFTCRLELHDTPLPILADAGAFLQASTNLLGNAMKYSGDSRFIILRTGRENGSGVLAVQDFGLGIRSEDIPHLFEAFFRSRSDSVQKLGGAGLGLSLVKHIVDAHYGRITVESSPGEGSTFRMFIDLTEE
jgi:signal transduction histidine kinase